MKSDGMDEIHVHKDSMQFQQHPEEYMKTSGASSILMTMMEELVDQRPINPLDFMAQFFENESLPRCLSNSIRKCYLYLKTCPPLSKMFTENVVKAFYVLRTKNKDSIDPRLLQALVKSLCSELPIEYNDLLIKMLSEEEHKKDIDFRTFFRVVQICQLFAYALDISQSLFALLDPQHQDRICANTFISFLENSIDFGPLNISSRLENHSLFIHAIKSYLATRDSIPNSKEDISSVELPSTCTFHSSELIACMAAVLFSQRSIPSTSQDTSSLLKEV